MAAFLSELRPQSLEFFGTYVSLSPGSDSFHALSWHGKSLVELKLEHLTESSMPKLSLLKGCTNLVTLKLAGNELSNSDLENSHNEVFLEMVAWLKECKKLRNLIFAQFFSASALMAPILLDNSIQLTSLHYESLVMRNTKEFHQALANKTSLHSLVLARALDEGAVEVFRWQGRWFLGDLDEDAVDADNLIESLSKLVNLTILRLPWITNSFEDRHIIQLARRLSKLEVWSTSGYGLTDKIWDEVASLRSLRRLTLSALARFTADGILDYIEKVGPGNKGLVLSMTSLEKISYAKQVVIQKKIFKKVQGSFNLTLISGD